MIGAAHVYYAIGAMLLWIGVQALRDPSNPRRLPSGLFWLLLSALLLVGDRLPKAVVGAAVLLVTALAGFGGVRAGKPQGDPDPSDARGLGHKLLLPVLTIPVVTILGVKGLARIPVGDGFLLGPDAQQATLASLALACLVALAVGLVVTRERLPTAIGEGRRLLEAIGWAALLPTLLAMLGSVLTSAGVGASLAALVRDNVPVDHRLVAVLAYGGGMTLLTMLMGNAFAAFPLMTAGIGLPILVKLHGAEPAALGAIGMLTGYCGTLMTPMAANFNIVPVALLGLPDQHAVIKAQLPTAIPLFLANLALLYFLAFP